MTEGVGPYSVGINQSPNHRIYGELVESEKDLIGLLAYGLYKRHKIDFLQSFETDKGRKPTDDGLRPFILAASVDNQLTRYRDDAARLLDEFSEELLTQQANEIRESIRAGSEVLREIRKLDKPLWHDVKANLWAAFISATITLAIVVGILAWNIGLESMLKELAVKWAEASPGTPHSSQPKP